MPESSKVIFNEIDNTRQVTGAALGINAFSAVTEMGPVGRDGVEILITSWSQYTQLFGGELPNSEGPTVIKRALEAGSMVRVNRILHYTDINDPTSYDALFSQAKATALIVYSADIIDGQSVSVTIGTQSIGQSFQSSSTFTLQALANSLMSQLKGIVADVMVASSRSLAISFEGAPLVPTSEVTGTSPLPTNSVSSSTHFDAPNGASTIACFALTPKYPGKAYNDITCTISNASGGRWESFDLTIALKGHTTPVEVYRNIRIPGPVTVANSTYLNEVVMRSKIVNVIYNDLSSSTEVIIRPNNTVLKYTGGTDGLAAIATDYMGSSAARTGWYAFDGVDDITLFGAADTSNRPIHISGSAYADQRKDLVYAAHLSNLITDAETLIQEKEATSIDSSYTAFFAGGILVVDSTSSTGATRGISELGDIFGISATSDANFGPWYSFAGLRRGIITNALGIVNNFGASGNTKTLDLISNHQIISVINRNKRNYVAGNFTGQLDNSILSWLSVRKFLIYLKKSLGPTIEQFLEDPNDIPTWKDMYLTCHPFLESLKTKRAMYGYDWQGDQFAKNMQSLQVNDPSDIDQGKYKVNLYIQPTPALRIVEMNIILTPSGVSFEDNLGSSL